MSVQLRLSTSINDSFLHIPPVLFSKIQNKFLPLIQLGDSKNWTFWCIQDNHLFNSSVLINSHLAELLGFKNYQIFKLSLGPFKSANISKVIARLRNDTDWSFLNSHFESIQSLILDQIRVAIRGGPVIIHTNLRKSPVILEVVEFGGYHPSEFIGILDNDTQLEIITNDHNDDTNPCTHLDPITFIAVPSNNFHFSASSINSDKMIFSFKEHSFTIIRDESVAPGALKIPNIILTTIFNLKPKDEIQLNERCTPPDLDFKGSYFYTTDNQIFDQDLVETNEETTIKTIPGGVLVKSSEPGMQRFSFPVQRFEKSNELFNYIKNSAHKVTLFYGPSGSGKTKLSIDCLNCINYSDRIRSNVIYCDLLTTKFNPNLDTESPTILILDHFDEYITNENGIENQNRTSFIKLIRLATEFISLRKESRLILVSRTFSFAEFSDCINILHIDHIFSLQKSDDWRIETNVSRIDQIIGLTDAQKMLEKIILHPLVYSELYRANGMSLNSGVLISGPTGSGKTFLAQKFIEHHKIPCIQVRGPEILDKYVGSSERAVRDLFNRARAIRPCLLFLDELDSIVPRRGSNQSGVTDRIVNQFLTELDGTTDRSGVFIIATSSRPDLIDTAITRAGRIDQKIELQYPKINELRQFLESQNLGKRSIKSFFKVLSENPNTCLSWADIASLDWSNSAESLKNLLRIYSEKYDSSCQDKPTNNLSQRLSLF